MEWEILLACQLTLDNEIFIFYKMNNRNNHIIIFDGLCNLCEYSVQFIIKNDHRARFNFVTGQSERGKELQLLHGVDIIQDGTVILVKDEEFFIRSDAALEIARELSGPWRFLYIFRFVPKPIRDFLYTVISKNRYQWFGVKNECLLPDDTLKDRFL